MNLVKDIKQDLINPAMSLTSILRKCRILAQKLQNKDFTKWVISELNGYDEDDSLPSYRVIASRPTGHFSGPWGSEARNFPIPTFNLPEEVQSRVGELKIHESVSALSDSIDTTDEQIIKFGWPANMIALVSNRILVNMTLIDAWESAPKSSLVGIIESVRNKILEFILEIEEVAPVIDDDLGGAVQIPPERIQQVFVSQIMGNVGNLAIGSHSVRQELNINVHVNDWTSLKEYLASMGIGESDLAELRRALNEETEPPQMNRFGPKVARWIGGMISKAAEGLWDFSLTASGHLLAIAISHYYGLA
jgi:hypothetical protein